MPYTISEIAEIKSLIESLLSCDGQSYDANKRAIEVGTLLQAHIVNQTPIADLREAVSAKHKSDMAWHDEKREMQDVYRQSRKRYIDARDKALASLSPKERALEEWYDEGLSIGHGNRDDTNLYRGQGGSLSNWLASGRYNGVSISQREMVKFLMRKQVSVRTNNFQRRWDAAPLIMGRSENGKYLAAANLQ